MCHPQGQQDDEIELDIDELPNDVLYKLLQFVRKYAPLPEDPTPEPARAAASAPAGGSRPKKNKPMSKTEQESRIQEIRGKLHGLKSGQAAVESEEGESMC